MPLVSFFADPLGRFVALLVETHFVNLSHLQLDCLPVDEPDIKLVVILFGWCWGNLRMIWAPGLNQLHIGQMSTCISWHFDLYLRSKSLLLDMLKDLFEGHQTLFTGLAAETRWDWTQKYPVIRISFSDGVLQNRAELDQRIKDILRLNLEALGLHLPTGMPESDITGNLGDLIRQAHQSTGQRAVVLIDEYDKPILDNITNSAVALEMREGLKNLYSVLKGSDEHLKFVFLTGVSKFSKVSLFSGLNNLADITLDNLSRFVAADTLLSTSDVDNSPIEALLF